jgi:hypothetical protein
MSHSIPRCRHGVWIPFFVLCALFLSCPLPAIATTILGSAAAFAVLGAADVTNTGASTLVGNLGVYGGTSITGSSTITLDGAIHQTDAVAHQAQTDANSAFTSLAAMPVTTNLSGQDLGNVGVLAPGVYQFTSSAQLTGALVLNFASNPNQPFVFLVGTALTTATGSSVTVIGGGNDSLVYWDVGSSATLGTDTDFLGTIIADQSITLDTGARIGCGRAIALVGGVTMDADTVSTLCNQGNYVPEPGSLFILTVGLIGLAGSMSTRKYWR